MPTTFYGCVICGYPIRGITSEWRWLGEFRVVYSSADGAGISGVGYRTSEHAVRDRFIAPSDPAVHWNDRDYHPSLATDVFPVMRQPAKDGRHGFILHECCWQLLQQAFGPADVPVHRLLDVCQSLPFPLHANGVCWGHNYGGLYKFDTQDRYPWEDRHTGNRLELHAGENPYDIPEISDLLERSSRRHTGPNSVSATKGNDCFAVLPWEVLESVAINLQTSDVLNLTRASRSFLPALTSQTFWASRFSPGHDRDFLFEQRNCKGPRDWAALYRLTSYTNSPDALKNRRRIWDLIQGAMGALCSRLDMTLGGPRTLLGPDLRWMEVSGDFQQYNPSRDNRTYPTFAVGCMLYHKQSTFIPADLTGIAFSTSAASGIVNLTGMRLISNTGEDICLGYVAQSKANEIRIEVATLRGFLVAVGSRGVHALQVISGDGRASEWIGNPEDAPVTGRLGWFAKVTALEVGVDQYKMVGIAVAEPDLPPVPIPGESVLSLRNTGLWYPAVPHPGACLNDEYFTGESPLATGYQPLIWTQFGGPGGIYLRSLLEISVTNLGCVCCIEFRYNTDNIPAEARKLGRRTVTAFSVTESFEIDGPGGELIQSIDAGIQRTDSSIAYNFHRHGSLASFKITTNRGRSASFPSNAIQTPGNVITPVHMHIAAGTTITGLYASQHPKMGIFSLGVVSEVIKESQAPE